MHYKKYNMINNKGTIKHENCEVDNKTIKYGGICPFSSVKQGALRNPREH